MRASLVIAAVAAAVLGPMQLASAGVAAAETTAAVVSTGSAEIPPSCVGKIDPIEYYIRLLHGTQPRHCL